MSSSTTLSLSALRAPEVDERTVLVVDDEPAIRDLISGALAGAGYRCEQASNGVEALERLAERESAFVLTDVRMPVMDGLELLDQVRVHHPDSFVILLTGAAEVPIVVRALRSGASDFLTKPFSIAELIARLHAAAERRSEYLRERRTLRTHDERIQQLSERYHKVTEGVLEALGTVLGARHPETQAHSERVAVRAADLASNLDLPQEDVRALYIAGLLHDMGKIAIDAGVLQKPGRLEGHEAVQMQAHPIASARIAEPVALSPTTVHAIRHHHERYDGSGYPDRLAGEQIPFGARILAVCDAFDAMTSDRPYQTAVAQDEGFSRLRSGAGSQWDPKVVEVFCGLDQADR